MPDFRNRIIGHGSESPSELLANPDNWRIHPGAQQEALLEVLQTIGWVQELIINKRTGHVVDGHLRMLVADRAGEASVPVKYVDLSPEEEKLVLATLDPLAALASTDLAKLTRLQGEVGDLLESFPWASLNRAVLDPDGQDAAAMAERAEEEWTEMPDYEQGDAESFDFIKVHFACPEDRAAFLEMMGEDPERKKSIWYPKRAYEKQG